MSMAEFEFPAFNVETCNGKTYEAFIKSLRTRLGERSSHNRLVLPVQEDGRPTRWFDMVLKTNAHSIKLRFRLGNLYLDGYQMEKPLKWLEFGNSNPHLISESDFLGLDGGYTGLANAAGQVLEEIKLGQQALMNAVNQLAIKTSKQDRARPLIVVIQMICESVRFIPISDYLTKTFCDANGTNITTEMDDLEHSWNPLSKALLRADAYPEESFMLPPNPKNLVKRIPLPNEEKIPNPPKNSFITTRADAADALGILLGLIFKPIAK